MPPQTPETRTLLRECGRIIGAHGTGNADAPLTTVPLM
jgi:hypothetical protein